MAARLASARGSHWPCKARIHQRTVADFHPGLIIRVTLSDACLEECQEAIWSQPSHWLICGWLPQAVYGPEHLGIVASRSAMSDQNPVSMGTSPRGCRTKAAADRCRSVAEAFRNRLFQPLSPLLVLTDRALDPWRPRSLSPITSSTSLSGFCGRPAQRRTPSAAPRTRQGSPASIGEPSPRPWSCTTASRNQHNQDRGI